MYLPLNISQNNAMKVIFVIDSTNYKQSLSMSRFVLKLCSKQLVVGVSNKSQTREITSTQEKKYCLTKYIWLTVLKL